MELKTEMVAQLQQENIHWENLYTRIRELREWWKGMFKRAEQEHTHLLARVKELMAQQDLVPTLSPHAASAFRHG